MESIEQKKVYKEVLEILKGLDLIDEIPEEIIIMFEENKDENWEFKFNKNVPLEEQKIIKNTTKLLSILYITYICKDENEKKELIKTYSTIQEEKDSQYLDDLFKNRKEDFEKIKQKREEQKQNNQTNQNLPTSKTKIFYRIRNLIEKIKKFFRRGK